MKKLKISSLIFPFIIVYMLLGFRGRNSRQDSIDDNNIKKALDYFNNSEQKDSKSNSTEIHSLKNFLAVSSYQSNVPVSDEYSNWTKFNIKGIGSILIPPSLELRKDGSVVALLANDIKENYEKVFNIGEIKSAIIFQPVGMNALKKEAINLYSRVLIDLDRGKSGDFYTNLELKNLTASELSRINEVYKTSIIDMLSKIDSKLLEWTPIRVESSNGAPYLKTEYLRQAGENHPVRVVIYAFHNSSEMIRISISYRETEKSFWKLDFEKIIRNFIIHRIN